jgi:DNA-binding FadR family transcriptional regulator
LPFQNILPIFDSSDDMMNTPINKRSLADEVADQLRQQINAGKFKVGEQLPTEPELMKQFSVGRSSVREAIRILANSGLLRVQQGVGTFIEDHAGITEPFQQRLKRAEAKDLDEVRHLLEMKIVKKAAECHTEKSIQKIKLMLDKRNASTINGTLEECVQADIDFHMSIAEAAGNPILADLYQSFAIQLRNWNLKTFGDIKVYQDSTESHNELYQCIKARDGEAAWKCIERIMNQ